MKIDWIENCARCGNTHEDVEMKPFTNPVIEDDVTIATHWAMCPVSNEPILIYVSESGKTYRGSA